MKRLFHLVPGLGLGLALALPGAGFWGPVVLLFCLIFFHELGHFLVAKWMGMPVEVFSLGFGQRICGFQWKETDVRLSILPLGGYVRLAGFNPEEPDAEDPYGFQKQPALKRLAFFSGGILANIAITVLVLFGIGVSSARITAMRPQPSPLLVLEVVKGMPGEQAGLQAGDQIRALGDLHFPGNSSDEALQYIRTRKGQPISTVLDREGRDRTITVVPQDEGGLGKLGVSFAPSDWVYERRPFRAGDLWTGAKASVVDSAEMGWSVVSGLGKLVTHRVSYKEVGGPIAIVRASSRAAKAGLLQYLTLLALISMNLAILNALPIPFLDGGHAVLLLIEKLRGKDLSLRVKERIFTGGFIFMAALFALIIFQDLWKMRH